MARIGEATHPEPILMRYATVTHRDMRDMSLVILGYYLKPTALAGPRPVTDDLLTQAAPAGGPGRMGDSESDDSDIRP